ncbi:bZIP transcription factor RISBZ4-like isoform X1 [Zingiber officinale]|uniref:bZIP transcription factor RISBZ4-like isoform X1 n=1 Tax=Zingiber officinale TaxID=94328 RepID=UPI001C4DC33C|nr:bZIP transcription factor RISBZ4-like isoform X1 [Zingiber officinale]
MKRSASELILDLEAFLRPDGDDRSPTSPFLEELLLPAALGFGLQDAFSGSGQLLSGGNQAWSQNLTPKHSEMESRSSICVETPASSNKLMTTTNQSLGASGSEQSDEESLEIEGGLCEQSTNVMDNKRMRRMVSNRESARRSRKRKQAHLADLELQVDKLRGESASLFKQLTSANQEFSEAITDNRILKSNVETLRIRVQMAEDMVTRGTLACNLDHLLQTNLRSPNFLDPQPPSRASPDFLPAINFQGNESNYIPIPTPGQAHNIGLENGDAKNTDIRSGLSIPNPGGENLHNGIASEVEGDIWACDSNVDMMPK